MMSQSWRLVRVIALENSDDDETVLRSGTSDVPLDEVRRWNGDALNLTAVDAYEGVVIRLRDQGWSDNSVRDLTFTLQVLNASGVWEDLCEITPVGSRYESTGDALADYRRSSALDVEEDYR
jgi:hypothetical protein